ncbi:MAG: hypothetical protein AB1567_03225 [bacterium]
MAKDERDSTITFGTREISYTYKFLQNLKGEIYLYQDKFGHPLEQGIQLD